MESRFFRTTLLSKNVTWTVDSLNCLPLPDYVQMSTQMLNQDFEVIRSLRILHLQTKLINFSVILNPEMYKKHVYVGPKLYSIVSRSSIRFKDKTKQFGIGTD